MPKSEGYVPGFDHQHNMKRDKDREVIIEIHKNPDFKQEVNINVTSYITMSGKKLYNVVWRDGDGESDGEVGKSLYKILMKIRKEVCRNVRK